MLELKEYLHEKYFDIFLASKFSDLSLSFQSKISSLYSDKDFQKKTFILIGSSGPTLWSKIRGLKHHEPDLFDNYTLSTVNTYLNDKNIPFESLYPNTYNNKIHFPLQQFSRELGFSHQSEFLLDIHHMYGTWFSFRALIVVENDFFLTHTIKLSRFKSPCIECSARSCLNVIDIWARRNACPIGEEFKYTAEQISYHNEFTKRFF